MTVGPKSRALEVLPLRLVATRVLSDPLELEEEGRVDDQVDDLTVERHLVCVGARELSRVEIKRCLKARERAGVLGLELGTQFSEPSLVLGAFLTHQPFGPDLSEPAAETEDDGATTTKRCEVATTV